MQMHLVFPNFQKNHWNVHIVPPVCERANYNTLCTNYPLQWWNWMASFSTWDESEKKEKRLRNLNICFLQWCCSHGIHDKLELKVFFTPLWAFEKKSSGKLLLNTSDMYSFSETTLWCFQACFLLHIERMKKRWKDSSDCLKNCLTFQKKNLDLIERDEYMLTYKTWHF